MKKLFIGVIVVIILTVCYFLFFRITKEKAISIITKVNQSDATALATMDEEYLIAWANGIRWHKVTFSHQGKNYLVETGRAM